MPINDGRQDVTEPGIGNVTLALYRDVNGNNRLDIGTDTLVMTTTTDADGGYIFNGLPPAVYFVDVTDQNNILAGLLHTGLPQSLPDPTGPISVSLGQTFRDADFGYHQPTDPGTAVIGDTVWWDTNQNGIVDPGEAGVSGSVVQLVDVNTGLPISNTTTDVNGNYLFTNILPGTYRVDVLNPPPGSTPSAGAPDPTAPFTVVANQQYLDADIGFVPTTPGTISGTLWNDTDNSGWIGATEPRLPGVSVDLLDTNGNIIATTTTDTNGDYTFTVPLGDYLVRVSDTTNTLANYLPTTIVPGTQNLDGYNKIQPYPVSLTQLNPNNSNGDFGYIKDNPLLAQDRQPGVGGDGWQRHLRAAERRKRHRGRHRRDDR